MVDQTGFNEWPNGGYPFARSRRAGKNPAGTLSPDSPFLLSPLTEKENLRIHSFDDIAAGKLLALFGRAEERDFIDIYCIIRDGKISLEKIIELAKKKNPGLDDYYLAIAFEQSEKLPDDASRLKVNLLTQIDAKEMKKFFAAEAVRLLEKHRR